MKLPIPKTIRSSKVVPKEREYSVNLFFADNKLLPRPGVEQLDVEVTSGECRGLFVYSERLYGVFGTHLYRYVDNSLVNVGTIEGTDPIKVAKGFNHAAICSPNAGNYTLSKTSVLAEITDPDLPTCIDVEVVNGYFIWVPANGDPLIYSAVGDAGDIDPLDFFDAEILPDKNAGVVNFRNDLFVLGEDSIERFRQVGPDDSPFLRVEGGNIPNGYISGKILSERAFLFLGRNKEQGPGFFSMEISGAAGRISTPAIDEILEREYSLTELHDCKSQRFQWRGFDVYVFTLRRHSFAFVNGNWCFFSSELDQQNLTPWDYQYSVYYNGTFYTAKSGVFGTYSTVNTDAGENIQHSIMTFARHEEKIPFTIDYLTLEVAQGVSDGGSIAISMSRDGKTYSDRYFIPLGNVGQYEREVEFRVPGGLGQYDGYAGIEIYTTSPISVAIDNAVIGI